MKLKDIDAAKLHRDALKICTDARKLVEDQTVLNVGVVNLSCSATHHPEAFKMIRDGWLMFIDAQIHNHQRELKKLGVET